MSLQKVPTFLLNFSEGDMDVQKCRSYRFREFRLDVPEHRLSNSDTPLSLTPKAFDVLSILVEHAGHLVEKEELMKLVWPDSFVEEANVSRIVHTLRKTLGDDGNGNSFIETVPTKGYRFVADVEEVTDRLDDRDTEKIAPAALAEAAPAPPHPVAFDEPTAETDGWRYVLLLGGAIILVAFVAGFWRSTVTLLPPTVQATGGHSANGEAYRRFKEGKMLTEVRMKENYKQALEDFERAIEIDPTYAEAYAGKADVMSYEFIGSKTHDDIATARAAAKRALELDPNNAYAHTIQCRILGTYDWEFNDAVTECQRAVELDPNDNGAHRELGFALNVVGRQDEALREMQTAVALSPTSFNKRSLAAVLYMSRRYDEAIQQLEQIQDTDPDNTDAERWLMSSFVMKNDLVNAFEHLLRLQEQRGASSADISAARSVFASEGLPGAVRACLDSQSGIGTRRTLLTAGLLAQIGEKDKAFEILDDMNQRRAIMMITVAREPLLDRLQDDPRFNAILAKLNLE